MLWPWPAMGEGEASGRLTVMCAVEATKMGRRESDGLAGAVACIVHAAGALCDQFRVRRSCVLNH